MISVAIIGDIHLSFADADVSYFNDSSYDLILLVGDLSNFNPGHGYRIARRISGLKKAALAIPGNHDTVNLYQLLAEIKRYRVFTEIFGLGQASRTRRLQAEMDGVQLGGYTLNSFHIRGIEFDVITARPFSMGGQGLSFRPYLRRRFGVDTIQISAQLLIELIDRAPSDRVIFLAHNGPFGLGNRSSDIWGCDFLEDEGDYGDIDLQMAVDHARSRNKRVIAVVAGHMHHELKGGGNRRWLLEENGTLYVNSARVPRIFDLAGRKMHHHIRLAFDGATAEVAEQLVPIAPIEMLTVPGTAESRAGSQVSLQK